MEESLSGLKLVPHHLLAERLETVRELKAGALESYEVMKDKGTGEHYLVYRYIHRDIAQGGEEENYHHLMPVDSDEVLSLLFGEQSYRYPEQWTKPYLRNGGQGDAYVWFDPANVESYDKYEQLGHEVMKKLAEFKNRANWTRNRSAS
ncbi:hypothetical protein N6H14_01435 [Paenibacillus sp. CC-CFT747]|nr:hypothetical protein N6H14_01435 [Paenibacillus sp. CC-CFT747]